MTVSLHLAPCPGTSEGEAYIPAPSVYTYAGMVYKYYTIPHKQWQVMEEGREREEREKDRDGEKEGERERERDRDRETEREMG